MRIVRETELEQLRGSEQYWAYNAMDCCVTREVLDRLREQLTPTPEATYKFMLACQSPAMAMMLRGIPVDHERRRAHIGSVKGHIAEGTDELQGLATAAGWSKVGKQPAGCRSGGKHQWPRDKRRKVDGGWLVVEAAPPQAEQLCKKCGAARIGPLPFEPASHQQVKQLLYVDMGLPRQFNKQRKVSVNKECLDRLSRSPKAAKHVGLILGIRQVRLWDKLRSILESDLDPDGRWRYSLNIGATETGRPSSSSNPQSRGSNTQNIPEQMRDMFTSDPGWLMFNVDLTTAESYFVAHRAGDEAYIKAHEMGDVHTLVCRDLWPELPWTKEADCPDPIARLKLDKAVAEVCPPWSPEPGHTYRFHAKRRQHGGNYNMSAFAMAIQLHIKVAQAQRDIDRYFARFPRLRQWHGWVRAQAKTGRFVGVLGRQRQFFGRSWDEHTFREALANEPQSVIADLVQIAMWHIWRWGDPGVVRLFQNGYDSLLGQVRVDVADETLAAIMDEMTLALPVPDIVGTVRTMVIPAEMSVGHNWGKYHETKNPEGMRKWSRPNGTAGT